MRSHDITAVDDVDYFAARVSAAEDSRNAVNVFALQDASPDQDDDYDASVTRPENNRSTTDPTPVALLQNYFAMPKPEQTTSRNRSPFSRSHLRSRSSGATANLPKMVRAHSMPAVHSLARPFEHISNPTISGPRSPQLLSSHSPQRSPARTRSPFVTESQDSTSYFPPPRSPHWYETANAGPIESIQEDSELDLTPRNPTAYSPSLANPPPISLSSRSSSVRRLPASPLHSQTAANRDPAIATEQDSPAFVPSKFTESFPSSFQLHHYASTSSFSSISTPSSARSRSPSISSLETIEDAPDAEYEAIEADRLWRLQLSEKGERGEDGAEDGYRRKGFGFSRGRNSERKRWSVCGGERRADLDLETIWED